MSFLYPRGLLFLKTERIMKNWLDLDGRDLRADKRCLIAEEQCKNMEKRIKNSENFLKKI
jgi:hypothetical protein